MSDHMAIVIRAVHQLDLQTHAYQEDHDHQRIAVARYHAARLLLALDRESKALGLDDELAQARVAARRRRTS